MSKCRKSAVIIKLESCCSYCAHFKKNLVYFCFSIYLHDLKLSDDPKCRLFHSVHGTAVFKWPGTQGGQVPDYVQYIFIKSNITFWFFPGLGKKRKKRIFLMFMSCKLLTHPSISPYIWANLVLSHHNILVSNP